MADRPFELRVMVNGDAQYGLALFQKSQRDRDANGQPEVPKMVVKLHGTPMKAVLDQVLTGHQAGRIQAVRAFTQPGRASTSRRSLAYGWACCSSRSSRSARPHGCRTSPNRFRV